MMLPPPPEASGVSGAGVEDWSPALAVQSFGLTFDQPEPVDGLWVPKKDPWLAFKGQEPSSVMYWELMKPGPAISNVCRITNMGSVGLIITD